MSQRDNFPVGGGNELCTKRTWSRSLAMLVDLLFLDGDDSSMMAMNLCATATILDGDGDSLR